MDMMQLEDHIDVDILNHGKTTSPRQRIYINIRLQGVAPRPRKKQGNNNLKSTNLPKNPQPQNKNHPTTTSTLGRLTHPKKFLNEDSTTPL
jgi:hypothetical protein